LIDRALIIERACEIVLEFANRAFMTRSLIAAIGP
jgi:hypothetical protein